MNDLHKDCEEEQEFVIDTDEFSNELTVYIKRESEEQKEKIISQISNYLKNKEMDKDLKALLVNDSFYRTGSRYWFLFNDESLYVYGVNHATMEEEILIFSKDIELVQEDSFLDYLIFIMGSLT